jgi:hypothetical protein
MSSEVVGSGSNFLFLDWGIDGEFAELLAL